MSNEAIWLYVASSIANVLDLITSYLAFRIGYTELNAFMTYVNNPYEAAAFAVLTYQLLSSVSTYFATRAGWVGRFARYFLASLFVGKVIVDVHNALLLR